MAVVGHIDRSCQLVITHQRAVGTRFIVGIFLVCLIAGRHRQPGCRRIVDLQNVLIPILRIVFLRRAQIGRFIFAVVHCLQAFVRGVETCFKAVGDSIGGLSVQIHIKRLVLHGSGKVFKFNHKLVDQDQALFFPAITGYYIRPAHRHKVLSFYLNLAFASVCLPSMDGNQHNLSG